MSSNKIRVGDGTVSVDLSDNNHRHTCNPVVILIKEEILKSIVEMRVLVTDATTFIDPETNKEDFNKNLSM